MGGKKKGKNVGKKEEINDNTNKDQPTERLKDRKGYKKEMEDRQRNEKDNIDKTASLYIVYFNKVTQYHLHHYYYILTDVCVCVDRKSVV